MTTTQAEIVAQIIGNVSPAFTQSGIRIERLDLPETICTLPFHAKQTRPGNTISGPTMMFLADFAMYTLVLALDNTQVMSVTQDLHMHFLARPAAQDLQAVGTVVKKGRRTVVMRVDIFSISPEGEKKLVAFATGTYALMA
ncbi:MAG TPA: PaaI family thioesterase [Aquirhabdus sp.]